MLVDYVRQYLPSTVPAPQLTPAGSITVTAGVTTGKYDHHQHEWHNGVGTGRVFMHHKRAESELPGHVA
jgi:hypothetical protein